MMIVMMMMMMMVMVMAMVVVMVVVMIMFIAMLQAKRVKAVDSILSILKTHSTANSSSNGDVPP